MPEREMISDEQKIKDIQELYAAADQEVVQFQAATGLKCSKGCGRCCENPNIEATVLELLPLALELLQRPEAKEWIERIETADGFGPCLFYRPDPLAAGHGRCAVYLWRPMICRLFGFATRPDKQGQSKLATCTTIKQTCSGEYRKSENSLNAGLASPQMGNFAMKVFQIDPGLGKKQLPINEAVKVALERVAVRLRYTV